LAISPPIISQPSNHLDWFFVCQEDPDHLPKIECRTCAIQHGMVAWGQN
jgi:hypothetical protein